MQDTTAGDLDEEEEEDDELIHGRRRRKVALMPSVDTTHTIFYKGHWLRITRSKRNDGWNGTCQELTISVVARNNSILKSLVLEAKKEYEKDAEHRVHIFMADLYGSWRWNGARQKVRPRPPFDPPIILCARSRAGQCRSVLPRACDSTRGYIPAEPQGCAPDGGEPYVSRETPEIGVDAHVRVTSRAAIDRPLSCVARHFPVSLSHRPLPARFMTGADAAVFVAPDV